MVNDLKGLKICSIMENNKSKSLGITNASYPAAYSNLLVQVFLPFSVNLFYCCKFHNLLLFLLIFPNTRFSIV